MNAYKTGSSFYSCKFPILQRVEQDPPENNFHAYLHLNAKRAQKNLRSQTLEIFKEKTSH